ncbi:LLM class flavin-dependent oxidoreductase [Desertimonas flava]|uniref:LLM class flavin-dependent oxidoreductase n=1 Tax=Desertimonas flava TaxID=2064846 RepID=UPI000E353F1B|nr:LLM class flavin-dependent oxidoreductase [Desertimonas flava]
MTTRFGWLVSTREGAGDPDRRVGPLVDLGVEAERLGFDSVWVGDSPIARPRPDAIVTLAAIAARTVTCMLGTAVLLPTLRHPVLAAHELATLDNLADGRLVAGLGTGFPMPATRDQFDALGVPYGDRIARFEAAVTTMRDLWRGAGPVELEPRPHRDGGPPLWFTGTALGAIRRAGRIADGWLPYPPDPDTYRSGADELERHAAAAGRPRPTLGLYATVAVSDDTRRARRELDDRISRYYGVPSELVGRHQALFAGTADDVAAWLQRYVDAGAEHVVIRAAAADQREALARVAADVLPRLRPVAVA